MLIQNSGKIKKIDSRHTPEVSKQTGFPSAATHYMETPIDLNKELTITKDATFYVRVASNEWAAFNILKNDVLIVDRSLAPKDNHLVLVVQDGVFTVIKMVSSTQETCTFWGVITYIIHDAL